MFHCVCLSSKPCHAMLYCTLACSLEASLLYLSAARVGDLHWWAGAHCRRLSTICCLCQNWQPIDCFTCLCGLAGTLTLTSCDVYSGQLCQKSLTHSELGVLRHVCKNTGRTRIWDRVAVLKGVLSQVFKCKETNEKMEHVEISGNIKGSVGQQDKP